MGAALSLLAVEMVRRNLDQRITGLGAAHGAGEKSVGLGVRQVPVLIPRLSLRNCLPLNNTRFYFLACKMVAAMGLLTLQSY